METKIREEMFRFDAYDVFGYLVPGSTMLIAMYIHTKVFDVSEISDWVKMVVPFAAGGSLKWHESFVLVSLFLFLSYIFGHAIASLSSVIMDKLVVERIRGFPYERLFHKHLSASKYDKRKRWFYRAILTLFLIGLIYLAVVGSFDKVAWGITLAFVTLIILKIVFTWLHQPDLRIPFELRPESSWHRRIANWGWKYVIKWLLWPISGVVFDPLVGGLLALFRMCKPFHPEFQRKFLGQFEKTFGLQPKDVGTDVYWLTYCYLCQKEPASVKLVRRWLYLYGFSRNLAVCFFLLFIYGVIITRFCGKQCDYYLAWSLVTGISAVVFGVRYYYLYYNYYSKFIFRAFVSSTV